MRRARGRRRPARARARRRRRRRRWRRARLARAVGDGQSPRSAASATVSARGGRRARRPAAAARRRASGRGTAASARPRPSSSATIATSTPDAHGRAVVVGGAQLAPAGGGDGGVELGRPARRRRAAPTALRAEPVDDLGGRVAERRCSGERRTSISRPSGAGELRRPLVAERAAQHLARRQPGDGVDDDDVAQLLVGGERVGDELLRARRRSTGLVGVELHGGHRHLAGPLVGDAEHGAVERRPGGRAARPRPRPAPPGSR